MCSAQLALEPWRPALLGIYESVSEHLQALDVPERALSDSAGVLVTYILGVAGQNAAQARALAASKMDRSTFLANVAAQWEQLDPFGLDVADLAEELTDAGALDEDLGVGGLERVLGVECPLAPGRFAFVVGDDERLDPPLAGFDHGGGDCSPQASTPKHTAFSPHQTTCPRCGGSASAALKPHPPVPAGTFSPDLAMHLITGS